MEPGCWPRKLHLSVNDAASFAILSGAKNDFFGRDGLPNIQRCFASLNMTVTEQHQQNCAGCFFPLRRGMLDSSESSLTDAICCCLHVCWCHRVCGVARIFWSVEEIDSASGRASRSIRSAKLVHRQRRYKSVRTPVLHDLAKERARTRYRPDVPD